jgi:putative SOS response-associated peptidase YedK
MCGRSVSKDQAAIERYFNLSLHQFQLSGRFNIAPGTTVPVIRVPFGERLLSGKYWGLIPSWAKDMKIAYSTINDGDVEWNAPSNHDRRAV